MLKELNFVMNYVFTLETWFHFSSCDVKNPYLRVPTQIVDKLLKSSCDAAFSSLSRGGVITLSSFRVNPEFQDFSLQPTGCLCEVIHIRRVDGGAL